MPRLPIPGSDKGTWGSILNDYLTQSLAQDGTVLPNVIGASQLQTDSVNAAALAPGSVTSVALSPGTVTASAIADGSITLSELVPSVQTSLAKADTALQTAPVTSVAGKTGVVTLAESDITNLATDLSAKAIDASVVHLTGTETVTGSKDFTGSATINGTNIVVTSDTRLTDARTPTAHAATHAAAGSDPVTLTKAQVGLGSVDNTSDVGKPVSTAQQTALNLKQNTLALTTTGSGAATLAADTLNVPTPTPGVSSVDVQTFTASGTWTKPAGAALVEAYIISGGGAGGYTYYGGGGGGGQIKRWLASALGATESVTVGVGGAGTAGGSSIFNDCTVTGGGYAQSTGGGFGGGFGAGMGMHGNAPANPAQDGTYGGGGGGGQGGASMRAINDGGGGWSGTGGGGGAGSVNGTPGLSATAGNGGSVAVPAGVVPGGGGGGPSGYGARGQVTITTYF